MWATPQGVNMASAWWTSPRSCSVGGRVRSVVVLAVQDVRAVKARLNLESQPPFDAPNIMMVKDLWGQTRHLAWLVAVEETAQSHCDMTGIVVHRPPDEELDVAHQVIIRRWLIPRLLAWTQAFLLAFTPI